MFSMPACTGGDGARSFSVSLLFRPYVVWTHVGILGCKHFIQLDFFCQPPYGCLPQALDVEGTGITEMTICLGRYDNAIPKVFRQCLATGRQVDGTTKSTSVH